MSQEALIRSSENGERYKLQDLLVSLSSTHAGMTMTQLAWMAAGGTVDADGYCQPADAFRMTLEFFNAKRRGCEIARNQEEEDGRRPNAKLVYGKALGNPYEFGGAGVYPIGGVRAVVGTVHVVAPVCESVAPLRSGMPDDLRAYFDE